MRRTGKQTTENPHLMLGILDAVGQDRGHSQRLLAAELGVALGLVNAYLKRCVSKGLVKIREAPARRYAYYLTPHGFAEKSRLTVEYLSSSFSFFRRAREDCSAALKAAHARGWNRVVLFGVSDLAEIATICAIEQGMTIIAVVDGKSTAELFVRTPIVPSIGAIKGAFDAVVVTDLQATSESVRALSAQLDAGRVLVPELLRIHVERQAESAA